MPLEAKFTPLVQDPQPEPVAPAYKTVLEHIERIAEVSQGARQLGMRKDGIEGWDDIEGKLHEALSDMRENMPDASELEEPADCQYAAASLKVCNILEEHREDFRFVLGPENYQALSEQAEQIRDRYSHSNPSAFVAPKVLQEILDR